MKIIYPTNYKSYKKISCIYKITNNKSGKIYIGQTTNYISRVSDYKNAHKKKKKGDKYIYSIISSEGSSNFTIEPLELCKPDELEMKELEYISLFDSSNPEKGYNILKNHVSNNSEKSRKNKSLSHIGLCQTNDTKRKKSNIIIAIKDDVLIIAESGKRLGQYFNKSKDYIKNCLRQPSTIEGWNLFYDDFHKRQEIKEKTLLKRSIRNKEYMRLLNILDNAENEGVETIYQLFEVYYLSLINTDNDDISTNGTYPSLINIDFINR